MAKRGPRGQNESNPDRAPKEQVTGTIWSAVGFWLTVFAATALLGSLVVAPRLERIHRLRTELTAITLRCARVDRQNERLAQFLRALQHDPSLRRQLAEWELKGRPADQMPALLVDDLVPPSPESPLQSTTWTRILDLLSRDPVVERAAFLAVIGLYLVALTFFRPASSTDPMAESAPFDNCEESLESEAADSPDDHLADDACLF